MEQERETLASAYGLDNESELLNLCIDLTLTTADCSEILNKLVCSHLNTKELVYCAFICGKMQEMDKEMATLFVLKQRIEKLMNQSK